jgi:hypothetical protein
VTELEEVIEILDRGELVRIDMQIVFEHGLHCDGNPVAGTGERGKAIQAAATLMACRSS